MAQRQEAYEKPTKNDRRFHPKDYTDVVRPGLHATVGNRKGLLSQRPYVG